MEIVARAHGRLDGRREVGRRVRMGAVAEDDVEQQHRDRGIARGDGELLDPQRRIDHRVRAALGVLVVTVVGELAVAYDRGRLRAQRAAAVEAAHLPGSRWAAKRSSERHQRPVGQLGGQQGGIRERARALDPCDLAGALVARAEQRKDHGLAGGDGGRLDRVRDDRVRRLGDDHDHARAGIRREQLQARTRHQPADLGRQVAAADADRVRDADVRGVEQAAHLLDARPGGADDPDRPAGDRVGEPERDAVDDRRAAVGPHEEQAALGRPPLQR